MILNNIILYSVSPNIYIKTDKDNITKKTEKIKSVDFFNHLLNNLLDIYKSTEDKYIYRISGKLINENNITTFENLPFLETKQICIDLSSITLDICKIMNESNTNVNLEVLEFIVWIYTYDYSYARSYITIRLDRSHNFIEINFNITKFDYQETSFAYNFGYSYPIGYDINILSEPFFITIDLLHKINKMISTKTMLKNIMNYVSFFIPQNKDSIKFKAETFVLDKFSNFSNGEKEKYEVLIKNNNMMKNTIITKLRKLQSIIKNKQCSYYFTGRQALNQFKIYIKKEDTENLIPDFNKFKICINAESFYIYKSLMYITNNKLSNVITSTFCSYIHPKENEYYIASHNIEYNMELFKLAYNFNISNISHFMNGDIYKTSFMLTRLSYTTIDDKTILNPTFIDDDVYNITFSSYKYLVQNLLQTYTITQLVSIMNTYIGADIIDRNEII